MTIGSLLGLVATGCSSIILLENPALVLNYASHAYGVRVDPDLRYGPGERHVLDVYRSRMSGGSRPVAVFFHGGGFRSGAKEEYRFVGVALASVGFVVVVPDYRLYPRAAFPEFLQDAADAVRWTKDNARKFGGDPGSVFLLGHSSGAYLAAMLALDPRWLRRVLLSPRDDIAGWIGLSGPYGPRIDGGPPGLIEHGNGMLPVDYVGAYGPPAFLATGLADRIVNPSNTIALAEGLWRARGRAVLSLYPNVGHEEIIGAVAPMFASLAPVLSDVVEFTRGVSLRAGSETQVESRGANADQRAPIDY